MSIWKDERGRYHIGLMHRGRRVHRCLPEGATAAQAKKLETKLRNELFRVHDLGECPDIPLSQAIQRYLDEEVAHHKARRITELKAYSLAPFVAGRTVRDIPDVAEELVRVERGRVAPATINRKLSILKRVAALSYKKWGWLTAPLGEKVQKLAGEREGHVYLSAAQVRLLVAHHGTRAGKDAALLAAYTGLRQSEIWSL